MTHERHDGGMHTIRVTPARLLGAAAAVGAAAVGAAIAVRRLDSQWAGAPGRVSADERLLQGDDLTLTTDDGATIAGTVAGDGPLVVLAHGWTEDRRVWAPVANRLVLAGRRVVAYDQRGHGRSSVGSDGLTVERLGADLKAVLAAVDARDAVLAGHSMGGMTIMSLATHDPAVIDTRANAVVLVATAAGGLSQGWRDYVAARVLGAPRLDRLMSGPFGHGFVRGAFGGGVTRDDLLLTRDMFVGCAPDVRAGWFRALAAMDLVGGLASIRVPTTILVGTRDALTPPHHARQIADAIPGSELVVIPGAGHMLPLEAPDEVVRSITGVAPDHAAWSRASESNGSASSDVSSTAGAAARR
jgi:pimeloyl-ACP methyl ester carboxylesterase